MTDMSMFLSAFHFVRPWMLLALPLICFLWWRARDNSKTGSDGNDGLAPHLRAAILLGANQRRRFQPIDGVCAMLAIAVLGASGPTWSRVPDPFVSQSAPVVVVLEVTPSMEATDVQPSRLERAKQKIKDLLDLRVGARTALVVYSATAHRVVPLTEDAQIMRPYLEGLSPDVLPEEGLNATAAMQIAQDILEAEQTPGGVLFILDSLDAADTAIATATDQVSVAFLSMLPESQRDRGLDMIDASQVIAVTPDTRDIEQIDRLLNSAYRQALLEDGDQPWEDRGWWFAWPAALLTLVWFRRGWTMKWSYLFLMALFIQPPSQARADGVRDWFFTGDQQGMMAFSRKDYPAAVEAFTDPLWQGYTLFRSGEYEKSAEVLGRLETAQAEFIRAIALIRNRKYRDGVRAFEKVLELDPDYPGAAENLETAREIVDYIEETRAQSDTGEDSGIGADETVFDNEANQGTDTEIQVPQETGPEILSTEQWMNTVNTQTGDFLRLRFLLEANKQP